MGPASSVIRCMRDARFVFAKRSLMQPSLSRTADPALNASSSLTYRLLGFDLCEGLPYEVGQGVVAQRAELSCVRSFLCAEYPSLTEEAGAHALTPGVARTKRRYLETACDLIELRHADQIVGVMVGAPEDWASYYIRIFALKRSFQQPRLIRRFCRDYLFAQLRAHDVQRVVADTSPANVATSRTLSELQFYVTGQQLSDRWGPLVRYTKFLDRACEQAFLERFAGIAPPGSEGRRKEDAE
jgi:hypothetical protein